MPFNAILSFHLKTGVRLCTGTFGILPMLNAGMYSIIHIQQIVVRCKFAVISIGYLNTNAIHLGNLLLEVANPEVTANCEFSTFLTLGTE